MLIAEVLRELDLAPLTHPHGKSWLSAASSLVCIGQQAYVIADDEHHLGHFTLTGALPVAPLAPQPVQLLRLFDGNLPVDKGKRKKIKPDLESLALLPALAGYPQGALLALGSGSKPNRCRALLLALDAAGNVNGAAVQVDLTRLYVSLQRHFEDLNIEGAFVSGDQLHLLQRGNKDSRMSACISFDWQAFAAWLLDTQRQPPAASSMQILDFGSVDGVPLCPTDAAALGDGSWIFCAVAENTGDSYRDGACVASAVGIVNAQGAVTLIQRLHGNPKVEGLAIESGTAVAGTDCKLLLVTDADDPALPAQLLRVTLAMA